mmetsp:Transcript_40753/g.68249  ORF Transcript_40753/g.68249 Transcript_40753/m.68249 type:complete len:338 (+) Transcript_40753:127-1140(+)
MPCTVSAASRAVCVVSPKACPFAERPVVRARSHFQLREVVVDFRLACPSLKNSKGARRKTSHASRVTTRAAVTNMSTSRSLLALDFDGVICDSCPESSLSGWKASVDLWPEVFEGVTQEEKDRLLSEMRIVRPVVETGYENLILLRLLKEKLASPDDLLNNWDTFLPEYMSKWQLDRADMVERFGNTRDKWIAEDFEGWLAPNEWYPGVIDATNAAVSNRDCEVYIVTTKQARFTSILLNKMAGIPMADERIFSTTVSGAPKTDMLKTLQEGASGAALHFVEDKLSTLQKVIKEPALDDWNLYLVDWGYNTVEEREWAAANDRINLIGIDEFAKLAL